jgi:Ca-activated chloride channel homolog
MLICGKPASLLVGASLVLAFHAFAAGGDDQTKVAIQPRPTHDFAAPGARIRVDSSLVLIPVSVTDPKNHLVTGLNSQQFRVFEGKSEQKVVHLSADDLPLSVGIVFDSSGSMATKMAKAREAVGQFLHTANPQDEFFLVNFSNQAQLAVPFTSNPDDIETRLRTTQPKGKTALLDAVYLGLHYMKQAHNPRRALLVISDGGDNDSRYTEAELKNEVRESDAWIYAIGIYEREMNLLAEEERGGPQLLTTLAEESGGRHVAIHDAGELPEATSAAALELRNQYILAYSPLNADRDGKYRRVQVKIADRSDLHLTWKHGYYAPEQ